MIKEYKTVVSIYGRPNKMAVIICDACKEEFYTTAIDADQGRRYCDMECTANARHYHEKEIIIKK